MDELDKLLMATAAAFTLWMGRVHWIVSHTLHIHRHADDHGFGTKATNQAIDDNRKLWMDVTNKQHRETEEHLKRHTRILRQIAHATEFYGEIRTGQKLPPQMDVEDDT